MFDFKGDRTLVVGQTPFIAVKKDLGATFANIAVELAKYPIQAGCPIAIGVFENTNATGAGVRFYIYAPNTGWKYTAVA